MDCVMCEGTRAAATRPKAVERDGKVAVIRDVPVEVCDSCGEVYLDMEVAKRLDVLFRQMLSGNIDQVFGHYEPAAA
jgi:YgiT-type zinc finger domain-containing protein